MYIPVLEKNHLRCFAAAQYDNGDAIKTKIPHKSLLGIQFLPMATFAKHNILWLKKLPTTIFIFYKKRLEITKNE